MDSLLLKKLEVVLLQDSNKKKLTSIKNESCVVIKGGVDGAVANEVCSNFQCIPNPDRDLACTNIMCPGDPGSNNV